MKKSLKRVYVLFIILSIFLFPQNIQAESYTSEFISIEDKKYYHHGDEFSMTNVNFDNYKMQIGNIKYYGSLDGEMYNISGHYIDIYVTVDYYDANYKIVARSTKTESPQKTTDYYRMNVLLSNQDFLNQKTVDDIKYYKISYYTHLGNALSGTTSSPSTTTSKEEDDSHYQYTIDNYKVDITVNENNTFDITEVITANFNVPKHGIIRKIPYRNTITRLDGTASKNNAKIKNLTVNEEYTKNRTIDSYEIKIGNANKTLTGEHKYSIKYTYNIGKDPLKDKDEFYYNIIGNEWDTIIKKVNFTIVLPKDFDKSKIGFSSGYKSSTSSDNVHYDVEDNTITGYYDKTLLANQGLTIRVELPDGYFVGAKSAKDLIVCFMFIVPILCLLVAYIIWRKYGKDDLVVETVEFYPPSNVNSLEAAFLYNGEAQDKDVTSLLIYLANKGYIKISDKQIDLESTNLNLGKDSDEKAKKKIAELENLLENEKKNDPMSAKIKYYENMIDVYKDIDKPIDFEKYGLTSKIQELNKKNKFTIKKLKDYDGLNAYEEYFFNGLFENGLTETNDKLLYNNFYTTKNMILRMINSKKNKEQIFEKGLSFKKSILYILLVITYLIITVPPIFEFGEMEFIPFAIIFPLIGFTVLASLTATGLKMIFSTSLAGIILVIFGVTWGLGFGGIPWLIMVLPTLLYDISFFFAYVVGILCIIGIALCRYYMPKRTKYGNEMLGKLRGFKNFLETVEKDKLEALVLENPTYFYDILPYTYVLNISDKWIKKFEAINLEAPNWYDSTSEFNVTTFNTFMHTTMTSAERAMTSSPTSSSSNGGSSGGSSSGGGSSGGGSGGGGGSSW